MRVVLARRQPIALDGLRREDHGQDADDDEHEVDEQREVVGGDDAEAFGVAIPQQDRGDAGADQADDGQAADRHLLVPAAERFRQQDDEARQA